MTISEKLAQLKALLQVKDTSQDALLSTYLNFAKAEILAWLYSGKTPEGVTDVPERYEPTQIMACVVGYGQAGTEGQTAHSEGDVSRTFSNPTMSDYIRRNVTPYVQVIV